MGNIIAQNAENNRTLSISAENDWTPVKGEWVQARCAGGDIRTLRVWEVGDRVVYLCSDSQYGGLQVGAKNRPAIGFPKHDVFKMADLNEA